MKNSNRQGLGIAILAVLLLVAAFRALDNQANRTAAKPTPRFTNQEPTERQMNAAQEEMAEWAEGRWNDFSIRWDEQESEAVLSVTADPIANRVAVEGYCNIMQDVVHKYLGNVDFSASVIRSGVVINC